MVCPLTHGYAPATEDLILIAEVADLNPSITPVSPSAIRGSILRITKLLFETP